jgi:hypothetical protein
MLELNMNERNILQYWYRGRPSKLCAAKIGQLVLLIDETQSSSIESFDFMKSESNDCSWLTN